MTHRSPPRHDRARPKPAKNPDNPPLNPNVLAQDAIAQILAALTDIREGSLEIVVHEGRISYIERRDREDVNLVCSRGLDMESGLPSLPILREATQERTM